MISTSAYYRKRWNHCQVSLLLQTLTHFLSQPIAANADTLCSLIYCNKIGQMYVIVNEKRVQ